jgi:hypothetical protein
MTIKYIKKTDKAKWTAENIKITKTAITGGLSIRKAADQFKMPFSTLQDKIKSGTDSDPSLGRCVRLRVEVPLKATVNKVIAEVD